MSNQLVTRDEPANWRAQSRIPSRPQDGSIAPRSRAKRRAPSAARRLRPIAFWGLTAGLLQHPALQRQSLTAVEQVRANQFRFEEDADSFRAAHLLVRVCASRAGVHSDPLQLVQHCDTCGGPHGAPHLVGLPALYVSLSHTRGAVIAAVATTPVGVDIERDRPLNPKTISSVLCRSETDWLERHPGDALKLWCRKEAIAKAMQTGLAGATAVDTLSGDTWTDECSDGVRRSVVVKVGPRLSSIRLG